MEEELKIKGNVAYVFEMKKDVYSQFVLRLLKDEPNGSLATAIRETAMREIVEGQVAK